MLAVADTHPLAGERQVALRDLADESFVTFPSDRGSEVRELGVRTCLAAGFTPRIAQEAPDSFTLLALVGANVGVALAVEAARTITLDHVVFLPLEEPAPTLPVSLVDRKSVV